MQNWHEIPNPTTKSGKYSCNSIMYYSAGKDWRRKEKGMTEDEMDGITDFNGHEFEQAPGVGGQESLRCYSWWGCKDLDTTERLNWTECIIHHQSRCFLHKSKCIWVQNSISI